MEWVIGTRVKPLSLPGAPFAVLAACQFRQENDPGNRWGFGLQAPAISCAETWGLSRRQSNI